MKSYDLISAANAASNITSTQLDLGDLKDFSIHCDFSDVSLEGTLKLQSSNDNSDYVDVTGSSQVVAAGASHMWNIGGAQYRYVRAVWTHSAGTGTLTAKAFLKELNVKGA